MITHSKNQEQKSNVPLLRVKKPFRIKSSSKDKWPETAQICSARSLKKQGIEQSKRIVNQTRHKKSGSLQTAIRLKIPKEEIQKKFQKARSKRKMCVYQGVKTEENGQVQSSRKFNLLRTINHQQNSVTVQKLKATDPHQLFDQQKIDDPHKISIDSTKFKKIKSEKQTKQPKGKYRCRVNQFVFDHTRKKSSLNRNQQQGIDQFWKNVNESLILAGKQQEQASKDLQEFVQHLVTQ